MKTLLCFVCATIFCGQVKASDPLTPAQVAAIAQIVAPGQTIRIAPNGVRNHILYAPNGKTVTITSDGRGGVSYYGGNGKTGRIISDGRGGYTHYAPGGKILPITATPTGHTLYGASGPAANVTTNSARSTLQRGSSSRPITADTQGGYFLYGSGGKTKSSPSP